MADIVVQGDGSEVVGRAEGRRHGCINGHGISYHSSDPIFHKTVFQYDSAP